MATPQDLRYTKTHEWVRRDGDTVTIGISDYAQTELGDITYVELPEVGDTINQNQWSVLGILAMRNSLLLQHLHPTLCLLLLVGTCGVNDIPVVHPTWDACRIPMEVLIVRFINQLTIPVKKDKVKVIDAL